MSGFSFEEHTADIGMKVWGEDRNILFRTAAEGMISLIMDPHSVRPEKTIRRSFQAVQVETLLHDWLSEILFMVEQGMAFAFFRIKRDNFSRLDAPNYRFRGILRGEPIDYSRLDICREIKAVTRHNFSLQWTGFHWEAQILFDV